MPGNTLNFVLQGRDALSRTLNGAGDAADRLRRRLDDAATRSTLALAGFTTDADGRLRDLQGRIVTTEEATRRLRDGVNTLSFADAGKKVERFGDELKSSLISLVPAAIPAVAGLAGAAAQVGAQLGAAGVAAAAYGAALVPQVAAISEVTEAQSAYDDAVATSGRTSEEAAKAQAVYQQRLDALPPATRQAAVAVGLLKDSYQEWSDSLADDVMGPFTKGVAVVNALLPKTSGLVQGASTQFDRLITMVGGGISSPGFDALNSRFTVFANDTMRNAVDSVALFLDRVDRGQVGGGMQEFLNYVAEAGPLVGDTLRNVGEAVLNVLDAASGVGMDMLDLINALSAIVAAVPPGAIAVMLQMAIAIKAVRLAAAGGAAASAGLAALVGQITLMRTAAAGTPGRLAGIGAAITTLSRTAKAAVAGTGIGLLLIALTELSSSGKETAPDVDKLTTALGHFGNTGKVTGEAASVLGKDFEKLRKQLSEVISPSVVESVNNWGAKVSGGFLDAGDATEKYTKTVDGIDEALAGLVSGGKADLAAAALTGMLKEMNPEQADKFTASLGDYNAALEAAAFEQRLAAESMGMFGQQAQEVQAKIDAQKASADGLRQSIIALNDVNRQALTGMIGFEAAIDAASKAAAENANVLDVHNGKLTLNTEAQRAAASSLTDLAAKTDEATSAARESGASWNEVSSIYERGRQQLIANAMQMGLTRDQAARLADQILRTPDKTAYLRGDLNDLRAKLADAKKRLANAPSSKTARIRGEISDLQRKIAAAERELNGIDGKTATAYINVRTSYFQNGPGPGPYAPDYLRAQGGPIRRAGGGPIPGYPSGGLLQGPGTSTSDSILLWGSNGEYMIKAASVAKYGEKFMDAVNEGRLPTGLAASPGRPAVAAAGAARTGEDRPTVTYNVYPRASVISVEDLRLIQRQEEARQRVGRPR
ncbi:hypothetical protein AB0P17_36675 [Streptomyces sp. NPDC088124]|uniref:hypothetical protein n=1 Tax=Streptomyces sp. NPDC088124 TaxID=3154654 RepID=UPI00341BA029